MWKKRDLKRNINFKIRKEENVNQKKKKRVTCVCDKRNLTSEEETEGEGGGGIKVGTDPIKNECGFCQIKDLIQTDQEVLS